MHALSAEAELLFDTDFLSEVLKGYLYIVMFPMI